MLRSENKENLPGCNTFTLPGVAKSPSKAVVRHELSSAARPRGEGTMHPEGTRALVVPNSGDRAQSLEKRLIWEALGALPQNTFVLLSVLAAFPDDEALVRASLTHLLVQSVQVAAYHAGAHHEGAVENGAVCTDTRPAMAILRRFGNQGSIYALIESLYTRWSNQDSQILRLLCGLVFDLSTAPEGRAALAARTLLLERLCAAIAASLSSLERPSPSPVTTNSGLSDSLHLLYYALGALGNLAAAGEPALAVLKTHLLLFTSCIRFGVAQGAAIFDQVSVKTSFAHHPMHAILVMKLLRECLRLLLNMLCNEEAAIAPCLLEQGLLAPLEQMLTWPVHNECRTERRHAETAQEADNGFEMSAANETAAVLEDAAARIKPMVARLHLHLIRFQSMQFVQETILVASSLGQVKADAEQVQCDESPDSSPQPWGVAVIFAVAFLGAAWHVGVHITQHHRGFQ
ncbi:hypothetical protein F1559_001177 [Cyanidiococcus yangmingshanensis]|uniref:Uncharacterized protein n=1 Tax=Cyanidiococcus yangmingshanensis TaxID=2690220 RepID=A0A7J7IKW9_9RHOD|nr:hypothetical protein F1559_001177 [Cyanidiococcus yangmingshanensis]